MILLAFIVALAFSPAASARQDGADPATPAPAPAAAEISTVQDALAAVNTVETPVATLRRAVRPLFKTQLEEALPTWLDHVQGLAAAGERVAPAVERVEVILDAIEIRGGDVTETRDYLKAVTGSVIEDVDPTDVTGLANSIKEWVVSPDGGIKLGLNILFFVLILILAKIIASIASNIVSRALNKVGKGSELLRDFLSNITGQTIFLVGIVVALGRLGINTGPLLAAIGAAGFIIGFALQGTLGNFAAGVMILLYRPYDIGDVVTAGGVTGKVQAMTLVSTTLLTPDNQINIVPNGSIWGDVITNVTGNSTRRVDMKFGIGYGDDVAKAEKVLTEIVSSHPKVLQDPAPVIKLQELADSSVNFVVRPWSATSDYWDVFFDVHREVKMRFDAEGIGIPFPQMDVHVHQSS
jgi:small conductance mechanosensitive channel